MEKIINRLIFSVILAGLVLSACSFNSWFAAKPEYELQFEMTGANQGSNSSEIIAHAKKAVVEIYSDNGIGTALLKSSNGKWPKKLRFSFHLTGLEWFEAKTGSKKFEYSFKQDEKLIEFKRSNPERKISPITVDLPREFLIHVIENIEIHWVDWYRE